MKLKLFQITFLSVVLALCGCAAERQAAGTAAHVVEQCPVEEGFPKHTVKAIPLTMPKDMVLPSIESVQAAHGVYVVTSKSNVYGFDSNGQYLCTYGGYGEGPAEYVNMSCFAITPQGKVVICDSYKDRMLYFDLRTGESAGCDEYPIGSLEWIAGIRYLSDSTAIITRRIYNNHNKVYALLNLTTKTFEELATTPLATDNVATHIGTHSFATEKGNAAYILPYSNVIYSLHDDAWIEIDTKQRVLTEEDLAKIKDFSPMTYAEHLNEKKTFIGYSDIFLLDDYIFLGFSNVEYSIIDKRTWKMRRFEYQRNDEDRKYIGLARIISYDPTNKTLIGINNSPFCEDDNLYIYTLQP